MYSFVIIFALSSSFLCEYYVSTFAGSGRSQFVDGQGIHASFNFPSGVSADSFGNVYVADSANSLIRKINLTGYVSTIAGNGIASYSDGQSVDASFDNPTDVAADLFGNIFVSDNRNNLIRKINASGYVTTVFGNRSVDILYSPKGLTIDVFGNLIVANSGHNNIRRINSTRYVSTIVGNGSSSFSDGQDFHASFNRPIGVAIDSLGNIFVGDSLNNRIRKINTTGYVSTFAGNDSRGFFDGQGNEAVFYGPNGIAVDSNDNLYVADTVNQRIRKIDSFGYVTTVAGSDAIGSLNGPGRIATFNYPGGITIDANGTIYVADYDNNKIRKLQYQLTSTGPLFPTITSSSTRYAVITSSPIFTPITTNTFTGSVSMTTPTNYLMNNNALNVDPGLTALILVFTGPTAYIMIVLGSICGILFARHRVKKDEAIRLEKRYFNKRQNIQNR